MSDPMFSPDGKWIWSGTEWIPAPPKTVQTDTQAVNLQDSVIGGDVVHTTVINNDATAVTSAVIAALQQLGVVNQQSQDPLSPPAPEIELPPSFNVGDHVEYHSPTNARWLDRCRVVDVNDDSTYRIEVPKTGGVIETKYAVVIGTSPGTIRPASSPYSLGDRVFVNWKNQGHYYPGSITAEHEDHTFLVHFDDGDVEDNVEWSRIEKLQEDSIEVQEYVENVTATQQEFQELIEAFKVFDEDNNGTISATEYFHILTEIGDTPLDVEEVMESFAELGIGMDAEINYHELARHLVGTVVVDQEPIKPDVIIRDAEVIDGCLRGYAYGHPKLGDTQVRTSQIQAISYDERATARVETRNTVYIVGPTGWKVSPDDHPFNKPQVNIRDAEVIDGCLRGYAYGHPKLGDTQVRTSQIQAISYDERATARVETRNTVYVVEPTGWKNMPENHPSNNTYSVGEQIKVEWKGSWWEGLIREISGEQYFVHYVEFDSSWDEWVTSERIQKIS